MIVAVWCLREEAAQRRFEFRARILLAPGRDEKGRAIDLAVHAR